MIKEAFLNKQITKAQKESRTPDFLRRLSFLVVDKVLIDHYFDSYSMKCLQSSLAISLVLDQFEIRSRAFIGEFCISQAFEDDNIMPSWNGFWGEDHHVWLCTEFGEFVDLTVKYLHVHPLSKKRKQLQVPAIWWSDTTQWPHVIKYLPQGPVHPELPEQEMDELKHFKNLVSKELESAIKNSSVNEIKFSPILHGADSMNELHEKGDMWLKKSIILQNNDIPHPPRIIERENELRKSYAEKPYKRL